MAESLLPQVDHLFIYLNDYKHVPVEPALLDDKITMLDAPAGDLGDRGKFFYHRPHDINLTVDDDLLYHKDYVNILVGGIEKYGGFVTLHGRRFLRPVSSFYRDLNGQSTFHCLREQPRAHVVDVPGTGVMGYCLDTVLHYSHLSYPNMADILVGVHAKRMGVRVTAIAHSEGLVQQLPVSGSIFTKNLFHDAHHTEIVNSHFTGNAQ